MTEYQWDYNSKTMIFKIRSITLFFMLFLMYEALTSVRGGLFLSAVMFVIAFISMGFVFYVGLKRTVVNFTINENTIEHWITTGDKIRRTKVNQRTDLLERLGLIVALNRKTMIHVDRIIGFSIINDGQEFKFTLDDGTVIRLHTGDYKHCEYKAEIEKQLRLCLQSE